MNSEILICLFLLLAGASQADAIVRADDVSRDTLDFKALVSLQTTVWDSSPPNGKQYIWGDRRKHEYCYNDNNTPRQEGDWRHFCSGTLLKPKKSETYVVLTSAGCVDAFLDYTEKLRVVIGVLDLTNFTFSFNDELTAVACSISKLLVHPRYSDGKLADVAMMEVDQDSCTDDTGSSITGNTFKSLFTKGMVAPLVKDVLFGDATDPAPIDNTKCKFYGWGDVDCPNIDDRKFRQPSLLQETTFTVINRTLCTDMWVELVNPDTHLREKDFCAVDIDNFSGGCNGDWGGPLVCEGKVAGVKTWGEEMVVKVEDKMDFSKMCSGCKPNMFVGLRRYVKSTKDRKRIKFVNSCNENTEECSIPKKK